MGAEHIPQTILQIILILLAAKLLSELALRLGQPPVLGELIAGIVLGGSLLGWIEPNESLLLLAELGVVLLLFEIGLESDLQEFLRVGPSALLVALIGIAGPFAVGYFVSMPFVHDTMVAVFIGATLTATSVGITARALTDMGRLRTPEACIILGAAVIDDVLGLIILAIVGGLVTTGCVEPIKICTTTILAIAFLFGAIVIGNVIAPHILRITRKLRTRGVFTTAAFLFCLILAYIAHELQLAMIVGAFAAGLVLARTEDQVHIQQRIKPIADILIPIFFVTLGLRVDISIFNPFNPDTRSTLLFIAVLSVVAILMKVIAGLGVLRRNVNKLVVGVGMIPRGEVGFIFASVGFASGIISQATYSAIIAIVVVTTFITPPLLKLLFRKADKPADAD